ncbi:hypothetical protein HT136_12795 [Novosphingobium profundi]|nr:hypothetical protein [Novosphingobium profundi]
MSKTFGVAHEVHINRSKTDHYPETLVSCVVSVRSLPGQENGEGRPVRRLHEPIRRELEIRKTAILYPGIG